MTADIKFIADVMLGKLARWLRILGFDTAYSNKYDDDEVIRIANAENRVILTRDRGLAARRMHARCVLISSDHYPQQVREVLKIFSLTEFDTFSRCIECNTPLRNVNKEEVFERVPPFVYLTQERFASCPSCNRVYWRGTHTTSILTRLNGGN
ncbi:MAG TPA: Mut7-C RNAse domain-containing protein [Terriglobia bacterium]|nr:Mut7-C RNAse domain-containing protein [Terriglobia bacterium]